MSEGTTHYEGCYDAGPKHYECALSEIRRLAEQGEPVAWEDRPDEWSDAIAAAHPVNSGKHKEYETALSMVGNRHSKGALVGLVCWLLQRNSPPQAQDALDAKRLDALISAVSSGEKDITICPPGNHGGLPNTWLLTIGGNDANVDEWEGTTLRAAIDVAMNKEPTK